MKDYFTKVETRKTEVHNVRIPANSPEEAKEKLQQWAAEKKFDEISAIVELTTIPYTNDWIENPDPLTRKVPDGIDEWIKSGGTLDVRSDFGHTYYNCDLISTFIGPQVITHYRLGPPKEWYEKYWK